MNSETGQIRSKLALIFIFIFATVFAQSTSTEMLVSIPYLSDKNVSIISHSLKDSPGIEAIEACYEMNVLIVHYNPAQNNETSILETIRTAEINSNAELKFRTDIPAIRRNYKVESVSFTPYDKKQ